MRKITLTTLLLLAFLLITGCGQKKTEEEKIENIIREKADRYSCTYDGVKHSFLLELPEKPENAPLVLMLPGYGNNAEAFRLQTGFDKHACPQGYTVAYVTGARDPSSPGSSLGWNFEGNPAGNRDVEFLKALAQYLCDEYRLDGKRIYAVGFSNGAFMTHRLAMEAQDSFAAFVSVAGLMPESVWKERRESNTVRFFQITGEKDDVVPKNSDGSAAYSKAPAIEDVMEYWAVSCGLDQKDSVRIGNASVLTKYKSDGRPQQIWHLVISEGRHSWPDERYSGINTNTLILEFLECTE